MSHASRLLRKALAGHARVAVTGDADTLSALDSALWQMSPVDFVAHCTSDGEAHVLARSPIVLLMDGAALAPHREVLLNLGAAVPAGFERFERLIDIVTGDEADRLDARTRWRHYAERGYAITRHDMAGGQR